MQPLFSCEDDSQVAHDHQLPRQAHREHHVSADLRVVPPLSSAAEAEVDLADEAELAQIIATHAHTFRFAARFLPPTQRQAVVALYAFFRTLDDLVDEPPATLSPDEIRRELLLWREWFVGRGHLPRERSVLGSRLAALREQYALPTSLFLDFLDGLTADLEGQPMRHFADLRLYCYQVAGTVGIAMTHVLGATSAPALAAAESLGIAMQLTNILRDVGGDLADGRIYLPQDELAACGLSHESLHDLYRAGAGPDARFRTLMRAQIARAHTYYQHGMAGVWLLPSESRLPILIAGRLYRKILSVIERNSYDVLRARAVTSRRAKVLEAVRSLVIERLWRAGEYSSEHFRLAGDTAVESAVMVEHEMMGGA